MYRSVPPQSAPPQAGSPPSAQLPKQRRPRAPPCLRCRPFHALSRRLKFPPCPGPLQKSPTGAHRSCSRSRPVRTGVGGIPHVPREGVTSQCCGEGKARQVPGLSVRQVDQADPLEQRRRSWAVGMGTGWVIGLRPCLSRSTLAVKDVVQTRPGRWPVYSLPPGPWLLGLRDLGRRPPRDPANRNAGFVQNCTGS